jgi:hypothetical protein
MRCLKRGWLAARALPRGTDRPGQLSEEMTVCRELRMVDTARIDAANRRGRRAARAIVPASSTGVEPEARAGAAVVGRERARKPLPSRAEAAAGR